MVERRSPESLQRRAAKRFIMTTAYYDRINSDTVCLKTNEDVTAFLCDQFTEGVILGVVEVVRGEVVTDSRGNGSFQK
jgi:hypothetical protein